MSMRAPIGMLACQLLVGLATAASAQGFPRLAVSAEGGSGPHTMQAGETYFREQHAGTSMLAVTLRLGRLGPLAPVVRFENEVSLRLAYTDDCPFAPNGTCREHWRQADGIGAGVGAFVSLTRWAHVGGLVGRQWDRGLRRTLFEARALVTPLRYVGITAAVRQMNWRDPEHGPLWWRPMTVGIQAQLP